MSSWISDYRQAQNYSGTGDVTIYAYIECDDIADLPSVNYFTGFVIDKESIAHVINGNQKYMLNSQGVWMLQEDPLFSGIYTKSEIDDMISDIDDIQTAQASSILSLQREQQDIWNLLMDSYNGYTKNLLNVFNSASGQTATINGVTWTVQSDGTVTANGTATANSFFYILPANAYVGFGVPTIMNGCPEGGSETTYEMQTALGSTALHDYGNGDGVLMGAGAQYRYVALCVRNGYTANYLTFKPMIVDEEKFHYNSGFVAWTPSLPQLYQMVRALQ